MLSRTEGDGERLLRTRHRSRHHRAQAGRGDAPSQRGALPPTDRKRSRPHFPVRARATSPLCVRERLPAQLARLHARRALRRSQPAFPDRPPRRSARSSGRCGVGGPMSRTSPCACGTRTDTSSGPRCAACPSTTTEGKLVAIEGIVRDITERPAAEEARDRQVRQAALRADVSVVLTERGTLSSILQRCSRPWSAIRRGARPHLDAQRRGAGAGAAVQRAVHRP